MSRRDFNALIAGLAPALSDAAATPEAVLLTRNGWVPNNHRLPVLIYRSAIRSSGPEGFEEVFRGNGWPPQWRNGIYPFHHYHSTAHEVLGFVRGQARIILGGENGREFLVRQGDVAVLPVGTGHCRADASADFLVVGAYPPGQNWDLCRSAPDAAAVRRMANLPFSDSDPVHGANGPLPTLWNPRG